MQITCIYCGLEVVITPERHRCRHCGGDLSSQVTPDFKASYYYQKASEAAEQGAVYIALQHLQKGLQAQSRPDLHLLAAILYADLGREEQLRMHIGAIPTNDILRGEAEALLKQLHARQQTEVSTVAPKRKEPSSTGSSGRRLWGPRLIATTVTMGVLLTALMSTQFQQVPWQSLPGLTQVTARIGSQVAQWFTVQNTEPELTVNAVTPKAAIAATAVDMTGDRAEEKMTVSTPNTEPVPAAPLTPGQWQVQVTQNVMTMISQERIDFTRILVERGYPELQDTELVAVVQGTQLVLMGTVPSPEVRQAVLDAARQLRGVGDIDAYAVQVVVPERIYVVQTGDNLWSIAQQALGDGARWPEILEYNPEVSNNLLRPGQELRIPSFTLPNGGTLG